LPESVHIIPVESKIEDSADTGSNDDVPELPIRICIYEWIIKAIGVPVKPKTLLKQAFKERNLDHH
jgi:hypothetical protein